MLLPIAVTRLIEESSGIYVRQPKGIEILSAAIAEKTGERIGETTLRRLYGFVEDERATRQYTLDIIAHFLDYDSWEQMIKKIYPSDSSFLNPDNSIRISDLNKGTVIEVRYLPDRLLLLEYEGNGQFKVIESRNSKLQAGDIAVIDDIIPHFPLHAKSIIRDGVDLGRYIAGERYGISSIRII